MAPKAQKPKILKVVRTGSFVEIITQVAKSSEQQAANDPAKPGEKKTTVVTSSSEFKEKAHEAPLPAFDEALQALAPVAAKVLDCDPSWKERLVVTGVRLSYTENNTRSVEIMFSKSLLSGESDHPLKTPMFQIDDDKKGGGRRQCAPKHTDLVSDFIKQAQRYAAGERSQQLLDFQDADKDVGEDSNIEQLPGMKADDPAND